MDLSGSDTDHIAQLRLYGVDSAPFVAFSFVSWSNVSGRVSPLTTTSATLSWATFLIRFRGNAFDH